MLYVHTDLGRLFDPIGAPGTGGVAGSWQDLLPALAREHLRDDAGEIVPFAPHGRHGQDGIPPAIRSVGIGITEAVR